MGSEIGTDRYRGQGWVDVSRREGEEVPDGPQRPAGPRFPGLHSDTDTTLVLTLKTHREGKGKGRTRV